jgi:hypothetical protein
MKQRREEKESPIAVLAPWRKPAVFLPAFVFVGCWEDGKIGGERGRVEGWMRPRVGIVAAQECH